VRRGSSDSEFVALAHFVRLEDVGLAEVADVLRRCQSDLDKIAYLKKSLGQHHKELTLQLNEELVFLVGPRDQIVEDLAKIKQVSSKVPAEAFDLLQTSTAFRRKITKLFGMFFGKQIGLKELV
jgi:hypothetical protein